MEQEQSPGGTPATRAMGKAISGLMGEAGVSRPKLALLTGIPLGSLRRYVQGDRSPDMDQLVLIADSLGAKWTELIERADAILLRESGGVYPRSELRPGSRSKIEPGDAPGITTPDVASSLRELANGDDADDDLE